MPYKEIELKKLYYTIGEVAETLDVSPSLLRFWEKSFDYVKPKKNKKGDRLYTDKEIDKLKVIYHYVKEKGYTLAGAKKAMNFDGPEKGNQMDVIVSLKNMKETLIQIRDNL